MEEHPRRYRINSGEFTAIGFLVGGALGMLVWIGLATLIYGDPSELGEYDYFKWMVLSYGFGTGGLLAGGILGASAGTAIANRRKLRD
jgi:hypothetical protein